MPFKIDNIAVQISKLEVEVTSLKVQLQDTKNDIREIRRGNTESKRFSIGTGLVVITIGINLVFAVTNYFLL